MLRTLLEKLFSWPQRGREEPFDFPTLDFPQVDLDEAAAELDLSEKAVANGSNEIPHSEATQLDGPQEAIRTTMKGRIRRVLAGYERRLSGLSNEIRSYDIDAPIDRVRGARQDLEQQLQDLDDELAPKIEEAHRSVVHAEEELARFKARHGIQREPEYPESHVWQWAMLIFACVFEALINAYFFHRGMEAGLVGGAFIALLLAFIDVLVVFWLGRGAVWARHGKERFHRLVGAGAVALFTVWALGYNLMATHIREHLQQDLRMSEALQQALASFLANPIGIEQADSIGLFVAGLVFSSMAFASGMAWEEKIPGYGKMHRKLKARREELAYWRDAYRSDAAALRDDILEEIDHWMREARDRVTTLQHMIETKDTLLATVNECIRHYRESCRALIQRYRDENMRARSTPPPAYFDESIEVELIEAPAYSTDDDYAFLAAQEAKLEAMQERLDDIRKTVRGTHKQHLASVDALLRRGRIGSDGEGRGSERIDDTSLHVKP